MRAVVTVALLVGGCDLVYNLDRPDTTGWAELSVGNAHVCGRTQNHELYCWGSNLQGEVGIGDELTTIDTATQIEGAWTQVSTAYFHTCALAEDQTASCWGLNTNGQLGTGSVTSTRIPKPLEGMWAKLHASYIGSCAIDTDAHLWCWGHNGYGQVGDGTMTSRLAPLQIGDARWRDVAMASLHTCGIQDDGTLWCWGDDNSAPIPDPALLVGSSVPVQVGTETWRSLATVIDGICGITTAGRLRCWGSNRKHQLGIGDALRIEEPTAVLLAGEDVDDWVQLEGGAFAACAVRETGDAWCWGSSERGELASEEPVLVVPQRIVHPDDDRWASVSVGIANACFVDTKHRAWCAGANSFSQLGNGGTSPRTPTPPAPDVPANVVAAGDHITCTIRDTVLSCGGKGPYYQIGDGAALSRRKLVSLDGEWAAVSEGYEHTCGVRVTGAVACWGTDRNENLGNGAGQSPALVPVPVMTTRVFVSIDAGSYFTCGVDSTRALVCWGDNSNGQLGANVTAATSAVPVAVITSQATTWAAVSAGFAHACGITSAGIVRCWGDNRSGQLGDNSMDESRTATLSLVSGGGALPAFAKISAGQDHTCAIGADNTLWCGGSNTRGQLGVDTSFFLAVPVAKQLPESWIDVAAGNQFTCAIRADTTLWCWGTNSRGQLGDGTLVERRLPLQVEGTGWTAVTAGTDHVCGQRGTNVLCWGNNDEGATLTGDAWTTELHEIVEPLR